MKQNLHPQWNHQCTVTCSCGNQFVTGASVDHLEVDICSACHPFFTGEMKFVDRQGRVEKFMKRQAAAQKISGQHKPKTKKSGKQEDNKSYKQILQEQQQLAKTIKKAEKTAASKTTKPAVVAADK